MREAKKPPLIPPSNGRIVWFTPSKADRLPHDPNQPLAAMIVHVWGDRIVNLSVFDRDGFQHPYTSVPLLQEDDAEPEGGCFCQWMGYQLGQAAKTEAAEAKAGGNGPRFEPRQSYKFDSLLSDDRGELWHFDGARLVKVEVAKQNAA